ncbi:MAG: hypothetical protein E7Z84_09185 [Methanosphaera stadtmanae]|nr:hypothetical protein [Methanosphaera stadtmanae]
MNEENIPKTRFSTIYGNYQFKVKPIGLCKDPGTFQREMNRIFFPLIGHCLFVYIDDLIVFSNSYEEHLDNLLEVFKIILENGLKLNLEKCNFFQNKVELLGHTISTDGIEPIQTKVKVVAEWLPPNTVNQLQPFLGYVGYYRKFIYNFASTAAAFCVKKFKSYISGNPYETLLYTDHKPLVSLFKNKETNNAR